MRTPLTLHAQLGDAALDLGQVLRAVEKGRQPRNQRWVVGLQLAVNGGPTCTRRSSRWPASAACRSALHGWHVAARHGRAPRVVGCTPGRARPAAAVPAAAAACTCGRTAQSPRAWPAWSPPGQTPAGTGTTEPCSVSHAGRSTALVRTGTLGERRNGAVHTCQKTCGPKMSRAACRGAARCCATGHAAYAATHQLPALRTQLGCCGEPACHHFAKLTSLLSSTMHTNLADAISTICMHANTDEGVVD